MNAALPGSIAVLKVETAGQSLPCPPSCDTPVVHLSDFHQEAGLREKICVVGEGTSRPGGDGSGGEHAAGRHDFVCFRAQDPSKPDESTIVVVDSASIRADGDMILFRIEASHYLWRMVRRVVGALVKVGKREMTIAQFEQLLNGRCDSKLDVASWTAPAAGLFLEQVTYNE